MPCSLQLSKPHAATTCPSQIAAWNEFPPTIGSMVTKCPQDEHCRFGGRLYSFNQGLAASEGAYRSGVFASTFAAVPAPWRASWSRSQS